MDSAHKLIVAHEVTNACNDLGQRVPMIEQTIEALGLRVRAADDARAGDAAADTAPADDAADGDAAASATATDPASTTAPPQFLADAGDARPVDFLVRGFEKVRGDNLRLVAIYAQSRMPRLASIDATYLSGLSTGQLRGHAVPREQGQPRRGARLPVRDLNASFPTAYSRLLKNLPQNEGPKCPQNGKFRGRIVEVGLR